MERKVSRDKLEVPEVTTVTTVTTGASQTDLSFWEHDLECAAVSGHGK